LDRYWVIHGQGYRDKRGKRKGCRGKGQLARSLLALQRYSTFAARTCYGDEEWEGGTAHDILRSMASDFTALKAAGAVV